MTRETRKACRKCGKNKPLRGFYKKFDNKDGHANICISCEKERNRHSERPRAESKCVDKRWKFGGPWMIIKDPDDSWGVRSSLTLTALRELIELEYVCVGLKLKHEKTGRIATIVRKDGALSMRYEGRV